MAVSLTKDSPSQQFGQRLAQYRNLRRNSHAATYAALNLIPLDNWMENPPLARDRGWIELSADYEHCRTCDTMRRVKAYHTSPGFCAGSITVLDLACGHQITHDDSYLES